MKPIDRLMSLLAMTLIVLIIGALIIVNRGLANVAGQEPSFEQSVFRVINAVTLTGFETPVNINEYKPLGQATVFILMVGGSLITLLVGSLALKRGLQLPQSDGQIIQITILTYLTFGLIGATVLVGPQLKLFPAFFQSASAFGNCGLVLGPQPQAGDWKTQVVLLPLAFIGGLGIPVLMDIGACVNRQHHLRDQTRVILSVSALLYVVGVGSIFLIEKTSGNDSMQSLINASTESLNSRTLGLPLGALNSLMPASKWIILVLMFVGGSPGGTAAGLKTTTVAVLVRDIIRSVKGQVVGRAFGLAAGWLLVYLAAIVLTTIALLFIQPQAPGEQMLWLTISALSNVGESHAPVVLSEGCLFVLSGAMLFGRVVPLIFLWKMARSDKPESLMIR
ncbi:MAG TPA: potassium transporter TrkG [Tepidisphaeraceae bacterium]|nr:potassium transporter TrkG [Tepidisphaeraceae bacterium]